MDERENSRTVASPYISIDFDASSTASVNSVESVGKKSEEFQENASPSKFYTPKYPVTSNHSNRTGHSHTNTFRQRYGSHGSVEHIPKNVHPDFLDSVEGDPTYISHFLNSEITAVEESQKLGHSQRIPGWAWKIIIYVLGVTYTPRDKQSVLSRVIQGVTLIVALTFSVTGMVHEIFDIRSKFTKTSLLMGIVNIVLGFQWICLGLYSQKLAARLFVNRNFVECVRLHSRTFLKISVAGLFIFLACVLAGINSYDSFSNFGPNHCDKLSLNRIVCHVLYSSHISFTVIAMLWNVLVGCTLLSVCRTHTVVIRRFISVLDREAKVLELISRDNAKKFLRMTSAKSMDFVSFTGDLDSGWFIWDDFNHGTQYQLLEEPPVVANTNTQYSTSIQTDNSSQCQVVLQGKSRNLIIRELQRTNLDVNLAVNNLLSRDDEGDDNDDGSQESYMPDDLMSLLDSGMHSDHPSVIIDADAMYNEDMFGYYSTLRSRGSGTRSRLGDRDIERERESIFRIRERRRLDTTFQEEAMKALDRGKTDNLDADGLKKQKQPSDSPLNFGEELQFFNEKDGSPGRFSHIAAMHSELVCVGTNGNLYRWRWNESEPYRHPDNPNIRHPKVISLGLQQEKVIGLSACNVRASVFTETHRVATWVDDTLNKVASKLEHSVQTFPEFLTDKIVSLHTCSLYTCARLESGALYWWGVMPFGQRKKMVARTKTKKKKGKDTSTFPSCSPSDMVTGSLVCLRSSPMYHVGALAFASIDGVPKVGQLLESAWSLNDTCRFKIMKNIISETKPDPKPEPKLPESKPDIPPPPSPDSSTCSDHSGTSLVSPASLKRKKAPTPVKEFEKKDEENWPLKNVVFVEDVKTVPVGKVIKVDGAYAAVKFQSKDEPPVKEDLATLLQDCRLLRKDDLQVVKSINAPRLPDCFQKTPKKVTLSENGRILAVAVDAEGIHVIARSGSKLSYIIYNLTTGKLDQDAPFPTNTQALMGSLRSDITLHNTGDELLVQLQDGNGAIYPLAKDCNDGIRDPIWLNLPPIRCLGMRVQSLSNTILNQKNKAAVIVLSVEMESPTSLELKCTCGTPRQTTVYEDIREMNISEEGNNNTDNVCLPALERTGDTDVDSDSLENIPLSLPDTPEVTMTNTGSTEHDSVFRNGTTWSVVCNNKTIKSISGSSLSGSCSSQISTDGKMNRDKSSPSTVQKKHTTSDGDNKTNTKKIFRNKTADNSMTKSKTNLTLDKKKKTLNKSVSKNNRRMSESNIHQTTSESHGIRETRLSRSRFEKCHEHHDGVECEGEDYLTPTQRREILLKDMRKEIQELRRTIKEKEHEQMTEKENFEKKLENILAERGTEIVILKSDIETLHKKNEDLQKSYQVSINTINMLEDNIRELKESIATKEKNNEHVFLETYKKGQMSALFERNEELERMAVSYDGSIITIKELLQKLSLTETELGKWQAIRRQESYDDAPKPETEADVILRFLKDSFYHYATDSKDCEFHLRAIIRMLNFTDVQKKKIAESIVAKRKNKNPPI